ncbi:MAG: hypothetical protein QME58_06100 [Bacteroidota bacterium]|nr:hypothetical protein [Bacteroidota bacterium]
MTVVSHEEPDGTELLLEPNENPAAKTFQESLFKQGIPLGTATVAIFDYTCGNLIQIAQM